MNNAPARDALDDKANRLFAGKVVRKDLVRKVKVGANVPVFVLEFLLGKYCASSDEMAIQMGLQVVNDTLANNYIRADESMKAQSRVKEKGRCTFIDKVKVRLVDSDYWAEVSNFGNRFVHIPTRLRPRLRAPADRRHLGPGRHALRVRRGRQGQEPVLDRQADADPDRRPSTWRSTSGQRAEFTTDEWIDLIVRSMGYEPAEMTRRLKLLFLTRLIPLCERNYNLVELGPRGTGKSYVVQEVSPYAALHDRSDDGRQPVRPHGRPHEGNGADLGRRRLRRGRGPPEDAQGSHHDDEDLLRVGQYQRGQEAATGDASIAMFGNTNQPVDVMVQTGHLFEPMPDVIRDDMAFIDRLHFYLPGWEIPKMRNELFTDHYGFVVDYLAEALRELRKHNFTEVADRHFSLGSHLERPRPQGGQEDRLGADEDRLSRTVSATKEEIAELLEFAMEGRRRVKEQLKKMGSFEYYQTSFSYTDVETGEERFVGVPEQGGRNLISSDPLAPGTVYAANRRGRRNRRYVPGRGLCLRRRGKAANGRRRDRRRRRSRSTGPSATCSPRKARWASPASLTSRTCTSRSSTCSTTGSKARSGWASSSRRSRRSRRRRRWRLSWSSATSASRGTSKALRSLVEPLQVAMDNGAKRALIPLENKRNFLEVTGDIMEHVDPIFFGDPKTAAFKALGLN